MEGEGTLGKLLTDESLYDNIGQTVTVLKKTAENAEKLTASISDYGSKLNQKGSLTNDLVSDTIVFNTINIQSSTIISKMYRFKYYSI